jgi:hypothetical protein
MEKRRTKPMTLFDELVTPPELMMLKLMLPYTPASNRQFLGVFAKFLELRETIRYFDEHSQDLSSQEMEYDFTSSPMDLFETLQPYMPPEQADMVDQVLNVMNMMEMAQMFQGNAQEEDVPEEETEFEETEYNESDVVGDTVEDVTVEDVTIKSPEDATVEEELSSDRSEYIHSELENVAPPAPTSDASTESSHPHLHSVQPSVSRNSQPKQVETPIMQAASKQKKPATSNNSNPMSQVMHMLTPAQREMFEQYNHLFEDQLNEATKKEDSTDERLERLDETSSTEEH